jgi:hypothetical protein
MGSLDIKKTQDLQEDQESHNIVEEVIDQELDAVTGGVGGGNFGSQMAGFADSAKIVAAEAKGLAKDVKSVYRDHRTTDVGRLKSTMNAGQYGLEKAKGLFKPY